MASKMLGHTAVCGGKSRKSIAFYQDAFGFKNCVARFSRSCLHQCLSRGLEGDDYELELTSYFKVTVLM